MDLLARSGNWYKGNMHMHTTVSDGVLTPTEAVRIYREAGYDFVAITDHRKVNPPWKDEDFLVMTGAEYDTGTPDGPIPIYHILGIGMKCEPEISYGTGFRYGAVMPEPQEIISAIRDAGGVAILAHPSWSVMTPEEMFSLHGLAGAEIYNSISGLPWNPERADSSRYFDIWAKNGKNVPVFAGDDSHRYEGEHCRAFTMVNAKELTQEAIAASLRSGAFYASQGPRFEKISYENGTVHVRAGSDVRMIVFYTATPWGDGRIASAGDGLDAGGKNGSVRASYRVGKTDKFVRVELIDKDGRRAWSSPYAVRV